MSVWLLKFDVLRYKKAANCCQVKAVSSFVQSYTVAQFDGWTLAVCHHTHVSRDHILWQAVSTALPQLNPKTSWLRWAAVARGEEMNLKKHLMIIWNNNVSNDMLWHHYPKALRELMQHICVDPASHLKPAAGNIRMHVWSNLVHYTHSCVTSDTFSIKRKPAF